MASEEAKLQYVTITQKLVGYGDEYYPAKVDTIMYNMSQSSVWAFWTTRSWLYSHYKITWKSPSYPLPPPPSYPFILTLSY